MGQSFRAGHFPAAPAVPAAAAPGDLAMRLGGMAYRRPFRRYQSLALRAFERVRATGSRRSYLVLPPGGGKTVLGLEIARRLGRPTVVLGPNTAIQAQWLRQWGDFGPGVPASSRRL